MTRREKLIQKLLNGQSIKTEEAIKIIESLGYESRKTKTTGSHRTFRKPGHDLITIVLTHNYIPEYTISDIQNTLEKEGYTSGQQ